MDGFVLLLETADTTSSLRDALTDALQDSSVPLYVCGDLAGARGILQKAQRNGNELLLGILDSSVAQPLACAQALAPIAPLAHWSFVGVEEHSQLAQQIQAPYSRMGKYYSAGSHLSPLDIERRLEESRQRYNHRDQLASINRQLSVSPKDPLRELKRFTQSTDFLTHLFETANEAMIATTVDGIIVQWNQAAAHLFGIDSDNALNRGVETVATDQWQERLPAILARTLNTPEGDMAAELRCRLNSGALCEVELKLAQIRDRQDNTLGLSLFVNDISVRKRAQAALNVMNRHLEKLSFQDGLTGVANRRRFDAALEQAWSEARRQQAPISLAILDLDHFKRYNDCLGHLAGDECLRKVAEILSQTVRRSSDMLARYGGEEFILLLPHTQYQQAKTLLIHCQNTLAEEELTHPDSPVSNQITFSCGIATIVPASDAPTSLVEAADQQLYRAKQEGRNRICTDHDG
ncbi:MAG: sensor domain-containing diguanylate cyclase [Marinobacter sp.]